MSGGIAIRFRWPSTLMMMFAVLKTAHVVVGVLCVIARPCLGNDVPSATSLLKSVEAVRTQYKSVRAELTLEYIRPGPPTKFQVLIELDGPRRRVELFPTLRGGPKTRISEGAVTLIEQDEVYSFSRLNHSDVSLYDLRYSVGTRGDVAFDPRILGLSAILAADVTVQDCLWFDNCELIGREQVHGLELWHVRATKGASESNYWIEEPSFRVHRRTIQTRSTYTQIDSSFYSSQGRSPFPTKVHSTRTTAPEQVTERIVIVRSMELDATISPERFTIKAMEVPINTEIVDYRFKRRVGYWDGQRISESPYQGVAPIEPDTARTGTQGVRFGFILLNIAVIVLLAIVIGTRLYLHRTA